MDARDNENQKLHIRTLHLLSQPGVCAWDSGALQLSATSSTTSLSYHFSSDTSGLMTVVLWSSPSETGLVGLKATWGTIGFVWQLNPMKSKELMYHSMQAVYSEMQSVFCSRHYLKVLWAVWMNASEETASIGILWLVFLNKCFLALRWNELDLIMI